MTDTILFRGGINTYETLDLSALHLKGLSVVHPMPSKIPVYCWSVKTTNIFRKLSERRFSSENRLKHQSPAAIKQLKRNEDLKLILYSKKGQNLKRASANPSTSNIFKWLSQFKSLTSKAEARSFPNTSKGGRENI